MNRGGSTEGTTPLKDAAAAATKSGRKVKRPAHFDDSPDKTNKSDSRPLSDGSAVLAKKSARKTLTKPSQEDTPKKTADSMADSDVSRKAETKSNTPAKSPELVSRKAARRTILKEESAKKSARKTFAKNNDEDKDSSPEPTKKSTRKTLAKNNDDVKDSSPEPEPLSKKSVRKTLLKSAVKNASSVEQEHDVGTPKKKVSEAVDDASSESGISRTGRKIKVPAHLKEFEDVLVPTMKKETPEVTTPRKSMAAVTKPDVAELVEKSVAPKTPGRGRSIARKTTEDEPKQEERVVAKTPGRRGKSMAKPSIDDASEDPLAVPEKIRDEKLSTKTPKRAKSVAPEIQKSPTQDYPSTKTPSKRGRSLAQRDVSPDTAPKTPRATPAAKLVEDSGEPISRSGRKIKPKKYFGEFEQEDVNPTIPKTVSPVKTASKVSTPVTKKEMPKSASPVKKIQKESPLLAKKDSSTSSSPVKTITKVLSPSMKKDSSKVITPVKVVSKTLSPVIKKDSPKLAKKGAPQKKSPSPVKRVIGAANGSSPPKRAKLEPKPVNSEKEFKISPNTEERQITIRGRNDHRQHDPESDDGESSSDPDPLTSSSENSVATIKFIDQPTTEPRGEESKVQDMDKPKRGRKTLPAPASAEDDIPKAPKTPSRKTIAPAVVAVTEDTGSSRSGRKIKPKKFFDDDAAERATAAAKPLAGGRGKRKTIAPVETPATETQMEPAQETTSPEEILSIVGAVGVAEENLSLDVGEPILSSMVVAAAEHDDLVSLEGQLESLIGSDQQSNVQENPDGSSVAINEESSDQQTPEEADIDLVELLSQPPTKRLEEEETQETQTPSKHLEEQETQETQPSQEATSEGNFQETRIEQTSPPPLQEMEPEAPNDRVPLVENPPIEQQEAVGEALGESIVAESDDHHIQLGEQLTPEQSEHSTLPEDHVASEQNEPEATPEQHAVHGINEQETAPEEQAAPEENEPQTAPEEHADPEKNEQATAPEEHVMPEQVENSIQQPDVLETATSTATQSHSEKEMDQGAEVSASSIFSDALKVEEDVPEPQLIHEEKRDEMFESVEFLEDSATAERVEEQNIREELPELAVTPAETPDIEDDLDKTEPPLMDDLDFGQDQALLTDVPKSNDTFGVENDRDDESLTVLPSTPKAKFEDEERVDLIGKEPIPHSSHTTIAFIEIPDTPMVGKEQPTPATPKTPESKPSAIKEDFSPDKPDSQEVANEPQEIIEISDSPIVTLLEPSCMSKEKRESATSTPVKTGQNKKLTVQERLIQNSRKRSLSASDADITKKNVTFHSPANSTILVDTIDERLKKTFKNESASKSSQLQRKRSLSEHKDTFKQDGVKPAKMSKLPNFKSIHENHFNRMESIDEYHNRKVARAKEVLANSTGKSPATGSVIKNERMTPHKGSTSSIKQGNGASSVVTQLKFGPSKVESHSKPLSDEARQEKRQKQFQAAFKPKVTSVTGGAGSSDKDTPDGTRRVVEQSRHKQHQIIKGVRTNKRFELLMKFRDAQD